MADLPLSDLKVLDLTHYVAGPYCTNLLAGLGAEVVKIERPGEGDGARKLGPFPNDIPDPEKSGLFLYLNTNKKGITLNLKAETGVKIFMELVKDADIVVENFSPYVMPSLGLDYETLEGINPRLVMTSISNFGQTGPYRDWKATDMVLFALGGIMYTVGMPEKTPLRLPGFMVQYAAGLYGFASTMTALYYRDETGIGQQVDFSIMEGVAMGPSTSVIRYFYTGEVQKRGPGLGLSWDIYPCKDGYVGVGGMGDWARLCQLMERPDLLEDERFATMEARIKNRDQVPNIIRDWVKDHTKEELYHRAQAQRFTYGAVYDFGEALESPHTKARDFFVEIDHPRAGRLMYPGAPFRMDDLPWPAERAPLLGEHNEEIYCGRLGYAKEDLVKLSQAGVI